MGSAKDTSKTKGVKTSKVTKKKKDQFKIAKLTKEPYMLSKFITLYNNLPYTLNNLELKNKELMKRIENGIKQKKLKRVQ